MRGPKRREIGHGALAEKAVLPVVPDADEFPTPSGSFRGPLVERLDVDGFGVRLVPLADGRRSADLGAGGGIAMGLIHRDGQFVTLTDILGAEDALGDMDFKVAGTANVITALQLDTKIEGLPSEVLSAALDQAKEARLKILEVMRRPSRRRARR